MSGMLVVAMLLTAQPFTVEVTVEVPSEGVERLAMLNLRRVEQARARAVHRPEETAHPSNSGSREAAPARDGQAGGGGHTAVPQEPGAKGTTIPARARRRPHHRVTPVRRSSHGTLPRVRGQRTVPSGPDAEAPMRTRAPLEPKKRRMTMAPAVGKGRTGRPGDSAGPPTLGDDGWKRELTGLRRQRGSDGEGSTDRSGSRAKEKSRARARQKGRIRVHGTSMGRGR